jgi:hypothetical protein
MPIPPESTDGKTRTPRAFATSSREPLVLEYSRESAAWESAVIWARFVSLPPWDSPANAVPAPTLEKKTTHKREINILLFI